MVDADETLEYESRVAADEDRRRNELRSLEGEKRPATVSNRLLNMRAVEVLGERMAVFRVV